MQEDRSCLETRHCSNQSYICQQDHVTKEKVLQSMAAMSSAQIVSASAMHNKAMAVGLVGGMLSPSVPIGPTYPSYGSQVNLVHVYASPHVHARECEHVCYVLRSVERLPPSVAAPPGSRKYTKHYCRCEISI